MTRPPVDIFRPVREGRRVVVDYAGMLRLEQSLLDTRRIYSMFHNYDVVSNIFTVHYKRKQDSRQRAAIHLAFCPRESADEAVSQLNKYKKDGIEHNVSKWQMPLKHIGTSWDTGRKAGHFSRRDQGSAVATNLESVGAGCRNSACLRSYIAPGPSFPRVGNFSS